MQTVERRQNYPVLEVKLNAVAESVRELSATVKEQFVEMRAHLDALQMQEQNNATLLRLVVGDGEPGHGRLGLAEKAIENLKRFFWQVMGGGAVVLFLLDTFFKIWK